MGDGEKALRRTLDDVTERWKAARNEANLQRDVNRELAREMVRIRAENESLKRGYADARFVGYEFRAVETGPDGTVKDVAYDDYNVEYLMGSHTWSTDWGPQHRRLYATGPWLPGVPERATESPGRGGSVWMVPEDPEGPPGP